FHLSFLSEIHTLSLHDALPIFKEGRLANGLVWPVPLSFAPVGDRNAQIVSTLSAGDEVTLVDHNMKPVAILEVTDLFDYDKDERSEEHTSELQSRFDLVCRLLL